MWGFELFPKQARGGFYVGKSICGRVRGIRKIKIADVFRRGQRRILDLVLDALSFKSNCQPATQTSVVLSSSVFRCGVSAPDTPASVLV